MLPFAGDFFAEHGGENAFAVLLVVLELTLILRVVVPLIFAVTMELVVEKLADVRVVLVIRDLHYESTLAAHLVLLETALVVVPVSEPVNAALATELAP